MFKRRKVDDSQAAATPGEVETTTSGLDTPAAARGEHDGVATIPALRPPGSFSAGAARPVDSGLGVPPFRPAPPKEAQFMGRSPFAAAPAGPSPVPSLTPSAGNPPAPSLRPSSQVPAPAMPASQPVSGSRAAPTREPGERRTLVVGRGISVQGTVQDAERLVVEGTVEASMIHASELSVSPGGVFKGEVEVDEAEVAGTIDGTLTAKVSLIVRASGRLLGTARCKRLQVEDGGQITGRIEMITDSVKSESAKIPADTAA